MKYTIFILCLLVALSARAANPAFSDFNTNQFNPAGNKIVVKNGALLTNTVTYSNATFNGIILATNAGITNLISGKLNIGSEPTDNNRSLTVGSGIHAYQDAFGTSFSGNGSIYSDAALSFGTVLQKQNAWSMNGSLGNFLIRDATDNPMTNFMFGDYTTNLMFGIWWNSNPPALYLRTISNTLPADFWISGTYYGNGSGLTNVAGVWTNSNGFLQANGTSPNTNHFAISPFGGVTIGPNWEWPANTPATNGRILNATFDVSKGDPSLLDIVLGVSVDTSGTTNSQGYISFSPTSFMFDLSQDSGGNGPAIQMEGTETATQVKILGPDNETGLSMYWNKYNDGNPVMFLNSTFNKTNGNLLELRNAQTTKFWVDYSGKATGNGSGLTNLNASSLASGTVPVAVMTNTAASGLTLYGVTTNGHTGGSNWVGGISLWNPATGKTVVATNGSLTVSGDNSGPGLLIDSLGQGGFGAYVGNAHWLQAWIAGNKIAAFNDFYGLNFISTLGLSWSGTGAPDGTTDVGIKRNTTSVLEINNGTAGNLTATLKTGSIIATNTLTATNGVQSYGNLTDTQNGVSTVISSNTITTGSLTVTGAETNSSGIFALNNAFTTIYGGSSGFRFKINGQDTVDMVANAFYPSDDGDTPLGVASKQFTSLLISKAVTNAAAASNGAMDVSTSGQLLFTGLMALRPVGSTTTNSVGLGIWNSNNFALYVRGTNGVDKQLIAIP